MSTEQKEQVPFAQATVELRDLELKTLERNLDGDRIISVGYSITGERCITIKSPTTDGKESVLKFGLRKDAAFMLAQLLAMSFQSEHTTTCHDQP